uniref:Uncharacterized protein n=1 Tax=Tanacetum cinerariifolium TaxID=118510 RepID=A0A6L2NZ54_TANCI|nr:hypothetical protein [Tanacetum cinerariifolium]
MALTFADTHNMIAFLTKSDASEGFDLIVEFLNAHVIQYTLMVFANIRRIGKGFSGVDTPLFDGMLVPQQAQDVEDAIADENDYNETCTTLTKQVANLEQDKIAQAIETTKLKQSVRRGEPAEVEEVIEVVVAAKLMTKVVTTATTPITVAQVPKASAPRRRGVIIQEPEETATTSVIMHSEAKSKDKGKVKRKEKQDDTVMIYQALKRKPVIKSQARKNMMIYLKNMVGFKMDFFRGMTYNEIRPIFEKHYNLNQAFLERVKEEIVANDDDDVYTEATPLALKVPVVDYQIHHEHNKPYYKIIKADETHQLFLSFITLLKNFEKEDLEML